MRQHGQQLVVLCAFLRDGKMCSTLIRSFALNAEPSREQMAICSDFCVLELGRGIDGMYYFRHPLS